MIRGLASQGLIVAAAVLVIARAALAADPITVGVVASQGGAPVFLAQALGYFAAEGLDAKVVQFTAAHQLSAAAATGDIDFGSTGINAPLCVFANDGELRIIGSGGDERPGFRTVAFIVSNKAYAAGLQGFRDLRGHSIATTQFGGAFQYDISLILKKYRLPEDSVRIVGLQTNGNVASAISGGQVDAALQSTANVYALVNPGKAQVLGWVSDELGAQQTAVAFTTGKMATEHLDTVRRFLDAFRKGGATWDHAFMDADGNRKDQPDAPRMIDIVATALNQPAASVGNGIGYFDPQARLSLSSLQDMLDWLYAQRMIKMRMEATSLVDQRVAIIAK